MALELKGVGYEFVEEDLQNNSDLLLKYNPVHKKIPVLVHKGKPIAESTVILEYIDETWMVFPCCLKTLIKEPRLAFGQGSLMKSACLLYGKLVGGTEDREKSVEEACELLKVLENELKDKKFFGGEDIGVVDIAANFIGGYWLRGIQEIVGVELLTKEKLPKLCEWSNEFINHAVINKKLPPRDKLIAFFRSFVPKQP